MKTADACANAPLAAPPDEWPFRDHRTMAEVMATARTLEPSVSSLAIREEEFCAWVERAAPGQRVEYHRGHLVADRTRESSPFSDKARTELAAVANRALALAEEGRLVLIQRRHSEGDYSYLAIKAKSQLKGRPARCPPRPNIHGPSFKLACKPDD